MLAFLSQQPIFIESIQILIDSKKFLLIYKQELLLAIFFWAADIEKKFPDEFFFFFTIISAKISKIFPNFDYKHLIIL